MTIDAPGASAVGRILAASVVALALAGCTGSPKPARQSEVTPATAAASSYSPAPDLPTVADNLSRVCDGSPYHDAPAYQGPGPHLTYLVGIIETVELNEWATSNDATAYELVGCVTHVAGPYVMDCSYLGTDGKAYTERLVRGDVQIRLLEVRTGRQITQVTIPGQSAPVCASILPPGFTSGDIEYGSINDDAVSRTIGPYVSRTVQP